MYTGHPSPLQCGSLEPGEVPPWECVQRSGELLYIPEVRRRGGVSSTLQLDKHLPVLSNFDHCEKRNTNQQICVKSLFQLCVCDEEALSLLRRHSLTHFYAEGFYHMTLSLSETVAVARENTVRRRGVCVQRLIHQVDPAR